MYQSKKFRSQYLVPLVRILAVANDDVDDVLAKKDAFHGSHEKATAQDPFERTVNSIQSSSLLKILSFIYTHA